MLKKHIKFRDLDDNPVEADFEFHLSKAELAELELGAARDGGFEALLQKIIDTTDGKELTALFKRIISMSIGERSPNGRSFIKSDEIRDDFMNSDAYSELFVELVTVPDKASEFINGLVSASLRDAAPTNVVSTPDISTVETPKPAEETKSEDEEPAWLREGRAPSSDEIKGATPEQLQEAFRRRSAAGQSS